MYKRVKQQKGLAPVCLPLRVVSRGNKHGMALVMAIMTAFILMALVASLFWVISSTQRQAEYARNAAAALNLAEAGVADAIYRLNYCTGITATDNYPFFGTYIPFDLTSDDTVLISAPLYAGLPPPTAGFSYVNRGIQRNLGNGYYVVGMLGENADATRGDTLIAVGTSKGTRRTLTVPLRGKGDPAKTRDLDDQGISEAFNKHVIYANEVSWTAGTVTGNIVCANYDVGTPTDPATWPVSFIKTKIDPGGFGVPTPVDPGIAFPPTAPTPTKIFHDDDSGGNPYENILGGSYVTTADFSTNYNGTVINYTEDTSYDIIGSDIVNTVIWKFESDAGHPFNTLSVSANTNNSFYSDKAVTVGAFTINESSGTDTAIYSGETVTINGATITGAVTAVGDITINGGTTITGNVKSSGNITIDAAANPIIINGCVVCNGTLTLRNSTVVNTITINPNAGSSTLPAALFAGSGIDIQSTATNLTITLGQNQKAAIMAYGAGAVSVTIDSDLTPTYSDTNGAQAAIVAYSSGSTALVTIGADINNAVPGRGRLIYSYGGTVTGSGVTLTTGTVYGTLITNGTVTLTSGTLTYDNTFFITPVNNNFAADIYQGFSGGRRVFVPVYSQWGLK